MDEVSVSDYITRLFYSSKCRMDIQSYRIWLVDSIYLFKAWNHTGYGMNIMGNRPISQIPLYIRQISHDAQFCNINMPTSLTKWCIVLYEIGRLYGIGTLWDLCKTIAVGYSLQLLPQRQKLNSPICLGTGSCSIHLPHWVVDRVSRRKIF